MIGLAKAEAKHLLHVQSLKKKKKLQQAEHKCNSYTFCFLDVSAQCGLNVVSMATVTRSRCGSGCSAKNMKLLIWYGADQCILQSTTYYCAAGPSHTFFPVVQMIGLWCAVLLWKLAYYNMSALWMLAICWAYKLNWFVSCELFPFQYPQCVAYTRPAKIT